MQQITAAILKETLLSERRVADIYSGAVSGKVPHGRGKYVWSDGCMYEGEWRKGRPSGRGRFSWPSGATYEGEFLSGRMHGSGTFVGTDGDTYTGSWVADRKHGFGVKRYANGDLYDGQWFRDLQHGRGRYSWATAESEYEGDWFRGGISGYGVLAWDGGKQRFEGFWEKGVPRAAAKLPRVCVWQLEGDITCDFVDKYAEEVKQQASPGYAEAVSKGHKKYELMLNVQLGIRYAVGKHAASPLPDLTSAHFDPSHKFSTRFPPDGSILTPPHPSLYFKWKDYCPLVFSHLRALFRIDPADYMLAICGNDALRQFSSPGKSGSFFYLTHDHRFIIKTLKKSELKVLIRMLPTYFHHFSRFNNSLLTNFFGLHCVKPLGGQKTRFVVMGNLFCSEYRIHRRYDLKGSSHGRTIDKQDGQIDENTTLKDLDLDYVFRLDTSWFQELMRQVERDCEFLESERIMDYSLLIGLHFRSDTSVDDTRYGESRHNEVTTRGSRSTTHEKEWVFLGRGPGIRLGTNMPGRAERTCSKSKSVELDHVINTIGGGGGESSCSSSTPSTPSWSGNGGEIYDVVLNFGIIDILQDYDITKKLEHAYKSLQVDPTSISAVDPKLYSKRFRDFIHTIFVRD